METTPLARSQPRGLGSHSRRRRHDAARGNNPGGRASAAACRAPNTAGSRPGRCVSTRISRYRAPHPLRRGTGKCRLAVLKHPAARRVNVLVRDREPHQWGASHDGVRARERPRPRKGTFPCEPSSAVLVRCRIISICVSPGSDSRTPPVAKSVRMREPRPLCSPAAQRPEWRDACSIGPERTLALFEHAFIEPIGDRSEIVFEEIRIRVERRCSAQPLKPVWKSRRRRSNREPTGPIACSLLDGRDNGQNAVGMVEQPRMS